MVKKPRHSTAKGELEPQPVVGLRIIGGSLGGRKLEYSGDIRTRPMKDRVREAVFNLLGYSVEGSRVVDLFAGTGAMAIEAVSRGAIAATCIERHYPTTKLIERAAAELGIADQVKAVFGDAFLWSRSFTATDETPLIVFCSPPYDFYVERNAEMLELIQRWFELCPARSAIVVEADERFNFGSLPRPESWDVRNYAPAVIGILDKESGP